MNICIVNNIFTIIMYVIDDLFSVVMYTAAANVVGVWIIRINSSLINDGVVSCFSTIDNTKFSTYIVILFSTNPVMS